MLHHSKASAHTFQAVTFRRIDDRFFHFSFFQLHLLAANSADDPFHFGKHLFDVVQPQLLLARALVIAENAKLMGRDGIALGWIFFGEEVVHGSDKAARDIEGISGGVRITMRWRPSVPARSWAGYQRHACRKPCRQTAAVDRTTLLHRAKARH
jgi:hypothetical protein